MAEDHERLVFDVKTLAAGYGYGHRALDSHVKEALQKRCDAINTLVNAVLCRCSTTTRLPFYSILPSIRSSLVHLYKRFALLHSLQHMVYSVCSGLVLVRTLLTELCASVSHVTACFMFARVILLSWCACFISERPSPFTIGAVASAALGGRDGKSNDSPLVSILFSPFVLAFHVSIFLVFLSQLLPNSARQEYQEGYRMDTWSSPYSPSRMGLPCTVSLYYRASRPSPANSKRLSRLARMRET